MSRKRPTPLFSANAPVVHEDPPAESGYPASLTERIRRFLLTDGEALFAAQKRQADYHQKLDETQAQPRN